MDHFLDGNGVAGRRTAVFGRDMTTTERRCRTCGEQHPVGSHRAFASAGLVLRCPTCDDVAIVIVSTPAGDAVELSGRWRL